MIPVPMSNDYFESDSQNRPYSVFGNEEPAVIEDPELKQLLPGMELCRKYRLEQKAGSGKMGTVWKSFDLTLNQHVALKFLPPEIRHQEKVIEQVYRAVQAMRVLNHQYICPIYGWENDPRFGSMIVMKWLNGATLEELIKEKQKFRSPFEPEQILTILQKNSGSSRSRAQIPYYSPGRKAIKYYSQNHKQPD